MLIFAVCVMAFTVNSFANEGEKLKDLDIPKGEILFKVNEDGSFITEKELDNRCILFAKRECNHEIVKDKRIPFIQTQSYNGRNARICYRTRTADEAHCKRCHKRFFIYGQWSYFGHRYPLFGEQKCQECGRRK